MCISFILFILYFFIYIHTHSTRGTVVSFFCMGKVVLFVEGGDKSGPPLCKARVKLAVADLTELN